MLPLSMRQHCSLLNINESKVMLPWKKEKKNQTFHKAQGYHFKKHW